MSRLGKKPIPIPSGVEVKIDANQTEVQVKGPKGLLTWSYPKAVEIVLSQGSVPTIVLKPVATATKQTWDGPTKALWGLARSRIANMIEGVTRGFTKQLEIIGVGYKAQPDNKRVVLSLGASHPMIYDLPEGVTVTVDPKQTALTITGIDKEKVGHVASNIRVLKAPEPYKGKGIRYLGEVVRRKAGKTAATAGTAKK